MSHLQLDYVAMEELGPWLQTQLGAPGARQVLGAAMYGARASDTPWPGLLAERAWPRVNLPVLGDAGSGSGTGAWAEVWTVPSGAASMGGAKPAVQQGTHKVTRQAEPNAASVPVHYACSDALLFAWVNLPLGRTNAALEGASTQAYDALFSTMQALGYPHPLRFWNYLPDILGTADGEERYRVFNRGRHAAFAQHAAAIESSPPAACALGHPGREACKHLPDLQPREPGGSEPLAVYVIASRQAGQPIENPRQTSAYCYPPRYGRQSPTFSRATVAGEGHDATLFVSGTASIVGHETLHEGDVRAQTHETLANIESLLAQVKATRPDLHWSLPDLQLKTYVRDPADLLAVREVILQRLGADAPGHFLQATVCRPDLLVEIEAFGGGARPQV